MRLLSFAWKQLQQQIDNTLAVVAQPRDVSDPARGCEPTRFKVVLDVVPVVSRSLAYQFKVGWVAPAHTPHGTV